MIIKFIPILLHVGPDVNCHELNQFNHSLYSTILVGQLRLGIRSQYMRHLHFRIIFLDEVPDMHVRTSHLIIQELPLTIFIFPQNFRVVILLNLLVQENPLSLALLLQVVLNLLTDFNLTSPLEGLQHNRVLDVFKHLYVDIPEDFSTLFPFLNIGIILLVEIFLPDPGALIKQTINIKDKILTP